MRDSSLEPLGVPTTNIGGARSIGRFRLTQARVVTSASPRQSRKLILAQFPTKKDSRLKIKGKRRRLANLQTAGGFDRSSGFRQRSDEDGQFLLVGFNLIQARMILLILPTSPYLPPSMRVSIWEKEGRHHRGLRWVGDRAGCGLGRQNIYFLPLTMRS